MEPRSLFHMNLTYLKDENFFIFFPGVWWLLKEPYFLFVFDFPLPFWISYTFWFANQCPKASTTTLAQCWYALSSV